MAGCWACPAGRGAVACRTRAESGASAAGGVEEGRRCRTELEPAAVRWSEAASDSESVWAAHSGKGSWEMACSDLGQTIRIILHA